MNNSYNAYKIVEPFNIDYTTTKSFESNSSINKNMLTSALNNIVNNCKDNVFQTNKAELSALASASNQINVQNTKANLIKLNNINMENGANVNVSSNINEKVVVNISNSFDSSMNEQLNNNNNLINQINNEELTKIINDLPTISGFPKPSAIDLINNMIGIKGKTNIDIDVNTSVKKMLNIDETFTNNSTNNVNNTITNTILQTNYAECAATAVAKNQIFLYDVRVENNIIIEDANMTARAQANLDCTFNQENISNISNNIITNISNNINNLYTGIKDTDPKKYEFLYLLSKAINDKIITVGHPHMASYLKPTLASSRPVTQSIQGSSTLPVTPQLIKKLVTPQLSSEPVLVTQQEPKQQESHQITNQTPTPEITNQIVTHPSFFETNKYLIFVGIIILTIIIIIIIIVKRQSN